MLDRRRKASWPPKPSCHEERRIEMPLSPEATEAVQSELKRFAADLNLSEDQKTRLKTALESAREKLDEVRKNNPDITKADVIAKLKEVRAPLRERVVAFLTAEQLTKWDAEVAKAKAFLGYSA
jgi:periplasmic protein CpxP/Spy